jgi:AcrR family transcriptional regulator
LTRQPSFVTRPYHHGDLRNALLNAARSLLEENGVSALTMREIARHVGVTAPAAYHHFRNLDAIVVGLAEVAAKEIVASLTEVLIEVGNARKDRLLPMGTAYVDFALRNPQLYRLLFGDGLSISSPARAKVKKLRQNVYRPIEVEMKTFGKHDNLYQRGVFLWSIAHGISLLLIDKQILSKNRDSLVKDILKLAGKSLKG